jgi:signal transduction histidine kinase
VRGSDAKLKIAMDEPDVTVRADGLFVSSNTPPSRTEKYLAFLFVSGLVAAFAVINYIADRRPHPIPGFALAFSTTMFVCDTVAAILLFAQFVVLRSLGLLVIANAYFLTAFVLIPYTMTFPGAFGPSPVIGSVQSTAFLYTTWHTGFCLYVFAYALLKDVNDPGKLFSRYGAPAAITVSVAFTAGIVSLIAWFVTTHSYLLPQTLTPDGLGYMPEMLHIVGTSDVVSGVCALVALWRRRRSALDLWLIVVVFLFVIDIPFTFYPVPVRFSVGWYFVRVTAFFSSSVLVIVLLYEVAALYARLSGAIDAQRREREARLLTGGTVAAMIAHEVKQPVSTIITRSETGHRWLDRDEPEIHRAKDSFKEISANGHRTVAVIESIRTNFRMDTGRRTSIDADGLIAETLNLVRDDLRRNQVMLEFEPNALRPRLIGDRVQLQQVLLNLITNAVDAMKARGGPRILRVASEIHDNGDVAVSVADTGMGIKPQDVERIFHPLFTTKADGMGMGLSICRSIIESHGGQIFAAPNKPEGAIIAFKLPAAGTTLAVESAEGLSA